MTGSKNAAISSSRTQLADGIMAPGSSHTQQKPRNRKLHKMQQEEDKGEKPDLQYLTQEWSGRAVQGVLGTPLQLQRLW